MAHASVRSTTAQLTPDEERIVVRDLSFAAEAKLKEGDTFYLLNYRWWEDWVEYVNQDLQKDQFFPSEHCDVVGSSSTIFKRPSTIDNSDLIHESALEDSFSISGMELHDNLVEGRDYLLLPQDVWKQIQSWYGGGPALPRRVIITGLSQTELSVEVYPLRLQLILMPKGDSSMIRVSRKETIRHLHQRAREIFDLNSEQNSVYIWDYYGQQKHALMTEMDRTLHDANIQMDQDILVEVVNNSCSNALQNGSAEKETTSIPIESSKSGISFAANRSSLRSSRSEISQNRASPAREPVSTYASSGVTTRGSTCGLTGLVNLGNTCFMNSAIQCLVHTPEFAKYFQDDYHQEINWHNPLGMVGELALAFGELLRKLWAPGRTPVAPRQFKAKLARFATQFSGYNQHDAQELLAFLLDGLHEDLNRVKHKPYMKPRDADGRPDEEVADEYWANHIARNDSIIVDVCQGQYKSTLICPVCNKISVTFDPFMYLSLPLQSTTTRTMRVTVFTCDGSSLPTVCTVGLSKQGRVRDLMRALSNACSLKHNEKLLIAEIQNHVIKRILEDPVVSLSTLKDDDHLAAYKVPKIETNATYLRVLHRYVDRDSQATSRWMPFGTPLVSAVSRNDVKTSCDLQKVVHKLLFPMLRTRDEGNVDISNTSNPDASEAATLQRLPLQLIDENSALIDLSLEEKAINLSTLSSSSVIYVNWSTELFEKYDTRHLENLREVFNGPATKKARSEPLSLYTCLEAFLREEPLVPEDMWYCPQCKERRQASKKLDLWRLPEVLVIHLKRFSYSRSMKHKLETFVNFPIYDLDLTNYVANRNNNRKQLYELYALINHYGSMGSGHYTAFIKLLEENKWYNFDDNHISSVNEEEVKSNAAYVLFFRRVNADDVSNGAQPV